MLSSERIAYFGPSTEDGESLYTKIENKLKTNDFTIQPYWSDNTNQAEFLFAVHEYAVVIVDCTLPSELNGSSKTVYPILSAQVNVFNHIIVISKTCLPLNITPYRGVYPFVIGEKICDDTIVEGITSLIESSLAEDCYNRIAGLNQYNLLQYRGEMERMITDSLGLRNKKQSFTKVMISYRSCHQSDVESFIKSIEGEDDIAIDKRKGWNLNDRYKVTMLKPGSLCVDDEAITPMRKWMMAGLLEDIIRGVNEVWVFETDDYTQSWWTIAELVMLANVNVDRKSKIRLRVYNPQREEFYKENDPKIDKYKVVLAHGDVQATDFTPADRLARLLSNTRPDTMGPECIANVRKLKDLAAELEQSSWWKRKLRLRMIRKMLEFQVPSTLESVEKTEMVNKMMKMYSNPQELRKYADDEVFQEKFWNTISYQSDKQTPAFNGVNIEIQNFMDAPMEELLRYSEQEFVNMVDSNQIVLDKNRNKWKIYTCLKGNEGKPVYRYLWHGTRMGQPVIKDAPGVEVLPFFRLEKVCE